MRLVLPHLLVVRNINIKVIEFFVALGVVECVGLGGEVARVDREATSRKLDSCFAIICLNELLLQFFREIIVYGRTTLGESPAKSLDNLSRLLRVNLDGKGGW